jgi:hypothetical protein
LVVPALRLYHEYTHNNHPNPFHLRNLWPGTRNNRPLPVDVRRLWRDTGMSAIFVILSGLLLGFSFVGPEENGLQILLSLAGGLFIIYQVRCLRPF